MEPCGIERPTSRLPVLELLSFTRDRISRENGKYSGDLGSVFSNMIFCAALSFVGLHRSPTIAPTVASRTAGLLSAIF